MKRQDYLDWDTTFMGIAAIISFRSKDPSTRHGAVIVDQNNRVLSLGYNGFARGVSDDIFPWTSPEKYDYVLHAERNAIDNSKISDLDNCKLYLWSEKGYIPCSQCAAGIIQKGIKEVIIAAQITSDTDKFHWDPVIKMFKAANVKIRTLDQPLTSISNIIREFNKVFECIKNIKGETK